uniref:BACK domain-containing protein n=1 Tax=Rhabditophanes sp. KR3021 TaxID=114890 RepID=A0AC35U4E9_9BILA
MHTYVIIELYDCRDLNIDDFSNYLEYICNHETFKMNESNVYQLVKVYKKFKCEDIKKMIMRWIKDKDSILHHVLLIELFDEQNYSDLNSLLKASIKQNFNKLYNVHAFDGINYYGLIEIFDTGFIKSSNQEEICIIFNRWVEYGFNDRHQYWQELLDKIDFSQLSKSFINKELIENPKLNDVQGLAHYLLALSFNTNFAKSNKIVENVFLVGGIGNNSKRILNYDVETETVSEFGTLQFERSRACSELVGTKLIVIGGKATKKMETFDVITKRSVVLETEIDDINYAFSTSKYNHQIWAFGGWVNDKDTDVVQCFDFEKMIWLDQKALPVISCGHSSVIINNIIYVTPGSTENTSMLRYDPRIKNWEKLAEIPMKRQNAAVCLNDNNIIYCGGTYEEGEKWINRDNCDIYEVNANKWRSTTPLPIMCSGNKSVELSTEIISLGGFSNGKKSISKNIPRPDKWVNDLKCPQTMTTEFLNIKKNKKLIILSSFDHLWIMGPAR